MRLLGIGSNIMSLGGIAIAIGAMVVILAVINRIDPMLGVMLLGVSTCCIGLSLLDTETPIKQIRARSKKRK